MDAAGNLMEPLAKSKLRVLEDTVEKDAGVEPPGFSAPPRPLPPGVQISETGDVFFREWVPGPAGRGWVVAFALASLVAAGAAWAALRGGWLALLWPVAIVAALAAATAVTFRGLSIVVDSRGIAWRFGVLGRRYAHEELSMFRERTFAFAKIGGWGIGKAKDGVDVYEVWGANGTALDLVVEKRGVAKHYLISTTAPDRLVTALVRASKLTD